MVSRFKGKTGVFHLGFLSEGLILVFHSSSFGMKESEDRRERTTLIT